MKVLISITSYERKDFLLNVVKQLKGEDIIIWDDNSNFEIEGEFTFHKFYKNYGKKLAWRKFQSIFKILARDNYDYYIVIPDDVILCDNFVKKSIELYENIKDDKKICLSLLSDARIKNPCWTEFNPVVKGDVILTQWNDLLFICERKFFEVLDLKEVPKERWDINPDLGSGVGGNISRDLYLNGYNMYHTKESLCTHRTNHVSKMNHNG